MQKCLKGSVLWGLCVVLACVTPVPSFADEPFPLEQKFARGVYWPWEHTQYQAEAAGMEYWAFVDHMMGVIRNEMNCNTIWFTNGPSDPERVADMAEKHGLTVLMNTKLNHLFYGSAAHDQMPRLLEDTTAMLKDEKALGAYVLKDEPRAIEAQQMESYRRAFLASDPTRPSIVVTMTGDTEKYVKNTGFPIICTDIYHFGGPGSPNIPNPSRRSRAGFRNAVTALTTMTRQAEKTAWVMPGAFVDVWGGSWTDSDGNIVIEPGSYWHWRMPTPAETQWQVWESLRAGVRGVIFYTILTCNYHAWNPEEGPLPERRQKKGDTAREQGWPLVKEQTHTGAPCCLTNPGGQMNAASEAMGAAFSELARLEPLLVTFEPSRIPVAFAEAPASVASFQSTDEPTIRFCVVVNDDVETGREVQLLFAPNVVTVEDLTTGQTLPLASSSNRVDGLREATLYLEPGAGAVLRVQFAQDQPGWMLFEENFNDQVITVKLENASRNPERRGYNMGRDWVVRKEIGTEDAGQIVIDQLTKHPAGPLSGALRDVEKGTAMVYLQIDGAYPRPESIVVQFVDENDKAGWNKIDHFNLPVMVPADTQAIRIRLADDASVKGVRMWRVPVSQETP